MAIAIPAGQPIVLDAQPPSWSVVVGNGPSHGIVTYAGESLTLDRQAMVPDQPYRVDYRGKGAIAVKHLDGTIVFYRLPER